MPTGQTYKPERKTDTDPISGVQVQQLTDYLGHSHHLYFTNPGWYDSGRKLLFGSDRNNRSNLYSLDLESGEITRLTDLDWDISIHESSFLQTTINPVTEEAYFLYRNQITGLDLKTLELRPLADMPAGFRRSMMNCTCDGRYVCVSIFEDLSKKLRVDYCKGYVGFAETHDTYPMGRIIKVATDGSGLETAWEEKYWLGHCNTSPTQPNLLTFCHEGPWNKVDHRIWCLDLNTGKPWKVRPKEGNEAFGHEYWYADGIHIGYHGHLPGGGKIMGKIKYDNTDPYEVDFPFETGHIHSNDENLIVGDGGRVIRMWKWNGSAYEGPRVLCEHRSSMHIQKLHAHPRFSADGGYVIFTSDKSGYGNVYKVEVPDFESLPLLEE